MIRPASSAPPHTLTLRARARTDRSGFPTRRTQCSQSELPAGPAHKLPPHLDLVPFQSPFQARLKARVSLFLDFEGEDCGNQSCGKPELSDDLKDAANRKREFRRDGTSSAAYRPQTGDILTLRI